MNKSTFDAFAKGKSPLWVGHAHKAAVQSRDAESAAYRSSSGTDIAEAPLHGLKADVFGCLAAGCELEELLTWAEREWRDYARQQQQRVEQAPKIAYGPRAGQSTIQHRWVSEEAWTTVSAHIRNLVAVWHSTATA